MNNVKKYIPLYNVYLCLTNLNCVGKNLIKKDAEKLKRDFERKNPNFHYVIIKVDENMVGKIVAIRKELQQNYSIVHNKRKQKYSRNEIITMIKGNNNKTYTQYKHPKHKIT